MNFRPQSSMSGSGGDLSSSPATGSHELGGAGLSAGVEGHITNPSVSDLNSAQSFFSPDAGSSNFYGQLDLTSAAAAPAPLSGAESLSLAQAPVPGVEQAMFQAPIMPGAESNVLAGVLAGANEPISPIIQLIMRLPGAMGLMNSFFEFFSNFFFSQISIFDLLNPAFLGAQAYTAISHTVHHMPLSLSILPAHAPIFQTMTGLGQPMFTSDLLSTKLNLSMGHAASSSVGTNAFSSMKSGFNVSSGIDLNKPMFEGVPMAGQSATGGGVLSGPGLSDIGTTNHIASNTRLFSDKIAGGNINNMNLTGSSQSSMPTNLASGTQAPVSTTMGSLNNNAIASGYQQTRMTSLKNTIQENLMGSRGTVEPAGFNYSDAANNLNSDSSALGPSGAVSNELGSKHLLAMENSKSFGPTISSSGDNLQAMNSGSSVEGLSSGGHVAGLKAKQLTLDSVKAPKEVAKAASPASPSHAKVASHSKAANHGHGHKASHHKPSHHKTHHRKAVSEKPQEPAKVEQSQNEIMDNESGNELIAQAEPGLESSTYTIKPGDNLWNIAKDSMGDGMKWQEVFDLNKDVLGTNPDLIYPGTQIELPGQMAEIAQNGASSYVVQPGDNLWNISKDVLGEGQNWGEIYQMNTDVIGSNPSLIHPGQNLTLPSSDPTGTALSNAANQAPTPQAPAQEMTTSPTGSDSMAESSVDTGVNTEIQSNADTGIEPIQENRLDSGVNISSNSESVNYDFVPPGGGGNSFDATVSHAPAATAQAGFPVIPANSQPVAGGPGAAYAATTSSGNTSVVSSGLMSDLSSFLSQKK